MKNWKEEAERMVRDQIARRGITNSRVLDAMKRVPRHLFVPGHLRLSAYSDQPLPIGEGLKNRLLNLVCRPVLQLWA